MLKSQKSKLTCSYCSKILRDPILLPCDDVICREHLSKIGVVKENRIKCKACNEEFEVKNNHFESNEDLKTLVESQSYLSEEESSLKKVLEDSMRQFFEFYDEFNQNKSILESDVYNISRKFAFKSMNSVRD